MRKVLFLISILFLPGFFVRAGNPVRTVAPKIEYPLFEKAVSLVEESEGWHDNHWPYVAYGHRVLPQERLTANMTRAQGDSLLRADLRKRCVIFRKFGRTACFWVSCLIRSVIAVCSDTANIPRAGLSGNWKRATGTFTGNMFLSVAGEARRFRV